MIDIIIYGALGAALIYLLKELIDYRKSANIIRGLNVKAQAEIKDLKNELGKRADDYNIKCAELEGMREANKQLKRKAETIEMLDAKLNSAEKDIKDNIKTLRAIKGAPRHFRTSIGVNGATVFLYACYGVGLGASVESLIKVFDDKDYSYNMGLAEELKEKLEEKI